MIAVDTNVLVYAHREDSPWHDAASSCLTQLAEGRASWAIPWPCVHEFLAIVSHPKIYAPPTPMKKAIEQMEAWKESPSLLFLGEAEDYWDHLTPLCLAGRIVGAQVHDARVAAICRQHGVSELWTADRNFGRFPGMNVRNPLIELHQS